jgi:pimeloyl-ACP methyl ester carboxylesterase
MGPRIHPPPSYQLLVPDLLAHGRSFSVNIPFAVPDAAALLADLPHQARQYNKADIISLSLGGPYRYVYGAEVSRSGRDRRTTVFLSGSGRPWRRLRSFIAWENGLVLSLGGWFL